MPQQAPAAPTESMSSMDPFMLIYTSGTTGRPKGTVHYHAGFPLKAAQDLAHLFDLRAVGLGGMSVTVQQRTLAKFSDEHRRNILQKIFRFSFIENRGVLPKLVRHSTLR